MAIKWHELGIINGKKLPDDTKPLNFNICPVKFGKSIR